MDKQKQLVFLKKQYQKKVPLMLQAIDEYIACIECEPPDYNGFHKWMDEYKRLRGSLDYLFEQMLQLFN